MARGRHGRSAIGRGWAVALVALLALGVVGGGTAYAAYRYDRAGAARILPGVSISGIDVGGMTRDEAIRAVTREADATLAGELVVKAAGATWKVTPAALGTHVDVQAAVDRAFAVADRLSFVSRVYHRIADEPVQRDFALRYRNDDAKVSAFVQQAFDEVARPAVDAELSLVDGQLVMRRSKTGEELKARLAARKILGAMDHHLSTVRVPVKTVEPEVSNAQLGKTIVVDISENTLYLYEGFKVVKQYRVATAAQGFVTPVGTWTVVNKVENPSWTNPDPTGWGADMPPYIPPGPSNPLGTRALYLNAPGIRIHGTTNVDSIGTYASHGCIRMLMPQVEELYPLVPIGTTVIVKP
jgi:lipoprotein-anchoring transpeptidase ErfK/SrfK